MALTAQRYRIRRRISQLRFLDSALLQPVCEVGRRRIVALRDELLGGPVGEQRLDFRTVLVQLAFAGAFRPSDRQAGRQAGSPSRAKDFFRPCGDQPRSISAALFPPKCRSKSSPKIGRRQIDDIYAVSIGYRKSYGGFGTFEPLGPEFDFPDEKRQDTTGVLPPKKALYARRGSKRQDLHESVIGVFRTTVRIHLKYFGYISVFTGFIRLTVSRFDRSFR